MARVSFWVLALVLSGLAAAPLVAGNWPQWRGPHGNSVSDEVNLPVTWSEQTGIVWKRPLPMGMSTPAIWEDAVFLTGQVGEQLFFYRLNKADGAIVWSREVGTGKMRSKGGRGEQAFGRVQNMASPSPVTDGERVIVHFGNGDLAAYDFAGNRLWLRNLQQDHGKYTIWWGHANSPVLWHDLVITVCMQDSLIDLKRKPSPSYIVAHDKRTGEERWKTLRMTKATAEECDSYITPVFHQTKDRVEMILMGGRQIDAYDPATGKQLWVYKNIGGNRVITGPTLGPDMVYATTGMRGPLLAVRVGGNGVLDSKSIAWQHKQATPDAPTPVLWKGLLFLVADNGVAQCLDAQTGKTHWQERLPGQYQSSLLAADDKIYFLNIKGTCTVVAAGPQFQKLAENQIDDETVASLAVSNGRLFLRAKRALYCIGKR